MPTSLLGYLALTRPISPHVDSELEYHPISLALFQVSCGPFAAIVHCQDLLLDCYYMLLAVMLWKGVLTTLQRPLAYTYTLVSSTPSGMTQQTLGPSEPC